MIVKGVSQNNNNDNRYKIRYRLRYTQNNIASSNIFDASSRNYKMQTTGANYLFEIPNVNRDYNTMIYKTREVEIFFGFDDESSVSDYHSKTPFYGDYYDPEEIYKDYEAPTTQVSYNSIFKNKFHSLIWWSLLLVRDIASLIFTIVFRVSGGIGVLTVTAVGLATLIKDPLTLDCLSEIQYIVMKPKPRSNRGNDCLSEIQDLIEQKINGM